MLFEVAQLRAADARDGRRCIVECAELVGRGDAAAAVDRQERRPGSTPIAEEMTKLEGRADELHDVGLKALFLQAPQRQPDGLHRRRRDLRPSGKGRRPLRGRRQRDQRHRHRARLGRPPWMPSLGLPILVGLIARRAAVRLPQRPARRGQFDRHHRLDPRAAAAICRGLGGLLQLHRLPVLRPARRPDRRHRHHRRRASSTTAVIFARPDRRHRLEPDHLVARHSLVAARTP